MAVRFGAPPLHIRIDGGTGDVLFGDVVADKRFGDLPTREHQHAIAEALQLDSVGRQEDDRSAIGGDFAENTIEFDAGAGIDAAGRFVGQ